jgi:hypothetical protein
MRLFLLHAVFYRAYLTRKVTIYVYLHIIHLFSLSKIFYDFGYGFTIQLLPIFSYSATLSCLHSLVVCVSVNRLSVSTLHPHYNTPKSNYKTFTKLFCINHAKIHQYTDNQQVSKFHPKRIKVHVTHPRTHNTSGGGMQARAHVRRYGWEDLCETFLLFGKYRFIVLGGDTKKFGIGFVVMGYRIFFYPIFWEILVIFDEGYCLLIYKINSKTI